MNTVKERSRVLAGSADPRPDTLRGIAGGSGMTLGFALLTGLWVTVAWGPNLGLAVVALLVFLAGLALLWRPTEPPVLLFLFAYQWLEASLSIFYANSRGVSIDQSSATGGNMAMASLLSLLGLLSLALGLRLGAGAARLEDLVRIRQQAQRFPQRTWLALYLGAYAVAAIAIILARAAPGLSQPLLALAAFKWGAYIAFTYVTFSRPGTSKSMWLLVFAIEFLSGLGGYFSSFKLVLIFTIFSLIFAGVRLSIPRFVVLAIFASLTILTAILWTAVKPEFRAYVRGQSTAQVVTVGYGDRLTHLGSLILKIDKDHFKRATENLVKRVAYVDIFALAVNYVPQYVPHAGGKVLGEAIGRPFMPRILFPSKAVIDETALTARYTGRNFAGMSQGTQISLGYMADSYIDFGRIGMMIAIGLIGVALGSVHRWLLRGGLTAGLVGASLSGSILLITANSLGNSSAKLFGGLIVAVLVAWLVKTVLGQLLRPERSG